MKNFLKIFFGLLFLALIAISVFIYKYKPDLVSKYFQNTDYSRSLYRQAMELQAKEDYRTAYYKFGKISHKYNLFDIVLYQQAQCAAAIEDEKTAIKKFSKILKSYPKSPVAALASYNLGQAYLRINDKTEAEKQFLYTAENFPKTDYAIGSLFYLGNLNKKKSKKQAIKFWLKYIALAPSGRFAPECYEGLKSLNYVFTEKDRLIAGITLFMQKQYREALRHFRQVPLEKSWYYTAMCYKELREKRKAISTLKKGLSYYSGNNISESKIKNAMYVYVSLNASSKYRSWKHILGWTKRARDFALYNEAQFLSQEKAKKVYEEIYNNYPNGQYASEALWNLLWYEFNTGNYNKAIELGEKHLSAYPNTNASPAVYFWFGKIYEKKKNNYKAKKFYRAVLKSYPDSYYAFRASGRLQALSGKKDKKWVTSLKNRLPEKVTDPGFPRTYQEVSLKHGEHVAEIIYLEDYETASLFMKNDPFIESWIKRQKGVLTNSIVTARNGMKRLANKPNNKSSIWKLIYPICYPEEINKNAGIYDLDPIIVLSLMKEESHFNPFAVSSSNARGLMQVLPVTARDIIRWKRLGTYRKSELFNPKVNIRVGTAYLGYTGDVFDGNMLFAVAAYNAGPAAVETWLKRIPRDDLDRFVENIPYTQTRNYVKKVFGSYWNYKRVYGFD